MITQTYIIISLEIACVVALIYAVLKTQATEKKMKVKSRQLPDHIEEALEIDYFNSIWK